MPSSDPILARPLPTADELRAWAAPAGLPRVTVALPLERAVPGVRQNAVQLEHAAREVEQRLAAAGLPAGEAAARAAALRRVEIDLARLAPSTRALALLGDARGLHAVALPIETPLSIAVAQSFAWRLLLRALARTTRHRVLAVSVNRVALFEGGAEGLAPASAPGLPASLADALGDEITEKEIRLRGTARGGQAPIYYSHGAARDEKKLDLGRFHEALARGLAGLGEPSLPFVIAGTEEHQSGLRALVKLPGLLEEGLTGNFDKATPGELGPRAAALVEAWLARRAAEGLASWERARNRGKGADLLDDVGAAALAGRVQRLWVDETRAVPGRVDGQTGAIVAGQGDDDALDALAELVLARGGEVIPVDGARLPSATGAAAELR